MSDLDKALQIAIKVHQHQKDRHGKYYILHPIRVMIRVDSEEEQIVAILHDVVEDSEWSIEMLRKEGFSENILEAIDCLTKKDGEDYMDYINRNRENHIARQVKIADLEDNMDMRRIQNFSNADVIRMKKYQTAWRYLKNFD
jgi:(p)ppGpp synthase/HD superfamily hydrolase